MQSSLSGHWQLETALVDCWDNGGEEFQWLSLKLTLMAYSHGKDRHQEVRNPPNISSLKNYDKVNVQQLLNYKHIKLQLTK